MFSQVESFYYFISKKFYVKYFDLYKFTLKSYSHNFNKN